MTSNEQLEEWVKGNSIHNEELGECCPDFSCCCKEIITPIADRQLYYEAHLIKNDKIKEMFLYRFLGIAISKMTTKKIHIAGEQDIKNITERN